MNKSWIIMEVQMTKEELLTKYEDKLFALRVQISSENYSSIPMEEYAPDEKNQNKMFELINEIIDDLRSL